MSIFIYRPSQRILSPLSDKLLSRKIKDIEQIEEISKPGESLSVQARETPPYQYHLSALDTYNELSGHKESLQQFCQRPLLTIENHRTLKEAMTTMEAHDIHHLLVVNSEGYLEGVLDYKMLLDTLLEHSTNSLLSSLNYPHILTIACTRSYKDAAAMMLSLDTSYCLLLDSGTICGLATRTDMLKILLSIEQKAE